LDNQASLKLKQNDKYKSMKEHGCCNENVAMVRPGDEGKTKSLKS